MESDKQGAWDMKRFKRGDCATNARVLVACTRTVRKLRNAVLNGASFDELVKLARPLVRAADEFYSTTEDDQ
jgi:hypothetical protein